MQEYASECVVNDGSLSTRLQVQRRLRARHAPQAVCAAREMLVSSRRKKLLGEREDHGGLQHMVSELSLITHSESYQKAFMMKLQNLIAVSSCIPRKL